VSPIKINHLAFKLSKSGEPRDPGRKKLKIQGVFAERTIEPIIGHLKADHRMNRCHLMGQTGDAMHAVLCAAGYNICWLLRMIRKKGISLFSVAPPDAGIGNLPPS
jgi:hypothetical protein